MRIILTILFIPVSLVFLIISGLFNGVKSLFGKEALSTTDIARNINATLSVYEMGMDPFGSAKKMRIRMNSFNVVGANIPALTSELKEAIAEPIFKESIVDDIFEYLLRHEYDVQLFRDNISLVCDSADRIISSLNESVDSYT